MKNLILLALLAAGVVLFFHDKQETADLLKAQDENAQLTQQIADRDAQIATLKAVARQNPQFTQAPAPAPAFNNPLAQPPGHSAAGLGQGQDPDSLDRPAYK